MLKSNKTQVILASLADLTAMGVEVVICKPGKAKGVKKQTMRGKSGGAFVTGGAKPIGYTQSAY
jgi:hypothetical protein